MPSPRAVRWAALPAIAVAAMLAGKSALAQERTLTIVLPEEPDIVDPCHASRSNIGRVVKQNVAETLTEIDPSDGSVRPRLATSWEQVDEKTWRFKLQGGRQVPRRHALRCASCRDLDQPHPRTRSSTARSGSSSSATPS